ncbi:MAG: protein-glutamate O-methyltransferase CheR [Actinomycetaceae bacterium]|nr:protein-glutamate O-methyltransferase CheR [Actinomycetaceae bacterium]
MTLSRDTFQFVADLVLRKSAIQLPAGKEYLVESRLIPLAREKGFTGDIAVDSYIRELRKKPESFEHFEIVDALTTNETSWFRDASPFKALTDVIVPELRKQGAFGGLRIWSAACSTGQEPYSIAMSLMEMADPPAFNVTATDLSRVVLAQAREGVYSQLEMNRGLPAPMLVRYFERDGRGWRANPQLRRSITFKEHNLLDPPPVGGPYDIVFIRNVLIYFDLQTKAGVLRRVASTLRPGGFLVLGAAETTMGMDPVWQRVDIAKGAVYRLQGGKR